mmetsp:Transcript_1573/g.2742  ORF Transcript_1573/g.2742 Transcript_1573/m.2742 type:complete len:227 (-) Transcript_1573:644-1324(-)
MQRIASLVIPLSLGEQHKTNKCHQYHCSHRLEAFKGVTRDRTGETKSMIRSLVSAECVHSLSSQNYLQGKMAAACCLIQFLLLFAYFLVQYVIHLLTFGCFEILPVNDACVFHFIKLVLFLFLGFVRRPAFWGLLLHPWARYYIVPCARNLMVLFVSINLLASIVKEEWLWSTLSSFITFTRISSGKGYLERVDISSWKKSHRISLFLVPWIVRMVVLSMLIIVVL